MNNKKIILEVKNLKKYFPLEKDILGRPKRYLRAVDDVTFTLEAGKTIGVVGESGCGKTTLGRTILQLHETTGGKTLYYGHSLEEFQPEYYLKEINKLPNYSKKYYSLLNKLIGQLNLEVQFTNKSHYVTNVNCLSLNDYNNLLNDLNSDILLLDKEVNKELYNNLKNMHSTVKNILCLLDKASCITGGQILNNSAFQNKQLFDELENKKETGLDLARLTKKELRSLRTEIQLIFQDPYSSLPPRMTVGAIITEAVKVHHIVEPDKINQHVRNIMKMCGLQPQYYDRYPHEFSGGQRQRICIARALAVNPKLVICDEPVSALDVSIQAQIINLLKDLQNNLGLTYMFISHDLSVVKYITDNIIVMYLGNMMEIGNTKDIFNNPLHPYTKALFSAVPVPDPDAKMKRIILKGDIPSPANPPKGCKFHTRCENCMSVCKLKAPKFIQYGEGHVVACHLYDNEVMANIKQYDKELEEFELQEKEKALLEAEKEKKSFLNKFKKNEK